MDKNTGKYILIIEDERKLAFALETQLAKEGFDIKIAWNGEEGMDEIIKQKPDIILLDLILPKLSGMDILRNIRKSENLKDLPVLIITNLVDDAVSLEADRLGVIDYLIKSNMSLSSIVELVKKYFKNK